MLCIVIVEVCVVYVYLCVVVFVVVCVEVDVGVGEYVVGGIGYVVVVYVWMLYIDVIVCGECDVVEFVCDCL